MALLTVDGAQSDKKLEKKQNNSQRISVLASNLELRLSDSVRRITSLNVETRFVALNARIEAGRAGGVSGRAFDVVAQAIQDISGRIADLTGSMADEFRDVFREMREITEELAIRSRGERLTDLALTNIDLIDRNLYERSCDVRWWATDLSFVEALGNPNPEKIAHASKRMGQILDSYTVYFDIVVTDLHGRVLANGRPDMFESVGTTHATQKWFVQTLQTSNGMEYVQSEVGNSSLCSEERTMVFACTIRSGGQADGTPLGVLAVVFRWDALAQTIVERTPLSPAEWERTRVCIVDSHGRLLADSSREFGEFLKIPEWNEVSNKRRGYRMVEINNEAHCLAHAHSPGYETYRTGWFSLLMQNDCAE